MPKIPTFSAQGRPTAEVGSIKSNVQMPLSTALTSIQSAVENYYVKEKQEEANIKSVELQTKYYNTQEDGSAGLSTIINESGKIPEPTEANNYYLQEVKKLQQSFENKYLSNENNFVKKAWLSKFNNSTAQGNLVVNQSARIAMDKKKVVEKDNAMGILYSNLVLNPNVYSPTFERDAEDVLSKTIDNENELAIELEVALSSRDNVLMQQQVTNNPEQFLKDITNPKKYPYANAEKRIEMIGEATQIIKDTKFNYLLSDLKILENKTSIDIVNDFSGIKQGTFNGDVNKIKLFESLKENEKNELINLAETQRKESNAEINNINSAIRYQFRDESISNSVRIYDSYKTKGIFNVAEINQVFGNYEDDINISTKQQFINLATKQGNNELKNISNYYKNDEITSKILEGKIKDISTPFVLQGEDKPLSILQRAGDGINSDVDLKFYIDYLLPNIKDPSFVEDNKELFKFIKKYQAEIEGPIYSKYIDKNLDNRLNTFKNDMFKKFIQKRKIGEPVKDLLSKESKKFIGNNISNYLPTQGEIEKGMLENFETKDKKKYPPKLPNETKDEYLKRVGLL